LVILHKCVPELSELALSRFLSRARRVAGLDAAVDLLLTSSREMKSLNRRFRRKDKATDVLSFPADGSREKFAGEIAISAEIAAQNAHALGHSAADEVKILALHGVLHLRGYDHERDQGEMARREMELRRQLGLPSGLIERTKAPVVSAAGRRGKPRLYESSATARTLKRAATKGIRRKKTR